MEAADLRAVGLGLVVAVVGVLGEVGWFLVYLVAGVMLTVAAMSITRDSKFKIRFFETFWWAVVGWGVAAAVVSSGDASASKATLASWGGALVIWAVVARSGSRGRRVVLNILLWGGLFLGISLAVGLWGVPGLITNDNIAVALIVSVVPLASERFRSAWRAGAVVALMLAPVLLTGSRAGVLAALVAAVLLWPKGRVRPWVFAVGGVCGGAAVAWRLFFRPESLAWHRWRIWGAILESIGDRPLWGIGAGGVAEAMGPYRLEHATEIGRWGHVIGGAESMPLGLAARIGLPALVLASVALGVWMYNNRRPVPATTAAVGAMITMGLFHDFLSEPAVLWWWAAILGLVTLRSLEASECGTGNHKLARWPVTLAVGGVVAWALVQPAWAQWLWWQPEPSAAAVATAVRAEPWYSPPMEWRVENLLAEGKWTWAQASEALDWSHRNLEIQSGSARVWSRHGRVNARIVAEFGAWPTAVENARLAFGQASFLEPRLPWHPFEQALMERRLGNLGEARRLVAGCVDLEPSFVRGWLLLARLELDEGHLDAARRALDRGLVARDVDLSKAWAGYHRDLLRCPVWQVEALEEVLR